MLSHDLLLLRGKTMDVAEGANKVPDTFFVDLPSPPIIPALEW